MEAPKAPEVTMANSSAVLVAELARARAEILRMAEACEGIAESLAIFPLLHERLKAVADRARDFLKE
jgi:hypothetical protein